MTPPPYSPTDEAHWPLRDDRDAASVTSPGFLTCQYPGGMNLRSGIALATLTLLPLAACSGTASTPSAPATSASSTASAPSTSPASSSSATAAMKTYQLSDVAKHNTQADCWAAIDGGVYDLTQWISRHPGGADKILPLCGTDASSKFETQHDSQEKPNAQLATFKVGELAD